MSLKYKIGTAKNSQVMDICHKSHINPQFHDINKKQHYVEPTLHYSLKAIYTVKE